MSFHYPTVNYQIPLHFRLKRGEPPLNPNLINEVRSQPKIGSDQNYSTS